MKSKHWLVRRDISDQHCKKRQDQIPVVISHSVCNIGACTSTTKWHSLLLVRTAMRSMRCDLLLQMYRGLCVCLSVCLFVCVPVCKNGWTSRSAVCQVYSSGPKEPLLGLHGMHIGIARRIRCDGSICAAAAMRSVATVTAAACWCCDRLEWTWVTCTVAITRSACFQHSVRRTSAMFRAHRSESLST